MGYPFNQVNSVILTPEGDIGFISVKTNFQRPLQNLDKKIAAKPKVSSLDGQRSCS